MATGQVMTSGDREFECVELGDIRKKKKVPRRIIHFASGETMEEYSTDEEEELQERKDLLPTADPQSKLTWGPYLWFYMLRVATSTLSVCDFFGEKIASVLGVSTPKYQYAIDEYYRVQKEVEEEEEENEMSEQAEKQYQEQCSQQQNESNTQSQQPQATSSFVNISFVLEEEHSVNLAQKQELSAVPT
ncbi:protein FAM177A1 isoform X2 [Mixophyes fleayi]|uniref:protein FAM177A1 isoform X2 n=1 Tax=Mixophyes fleayi TaxID=3061075 RepID=UPI003F4E1553